MSTTTFNYELKVVSSDDPYPTYKWMRDNEPAHYSALEDVWVLTRYEDVSEAFRDWRAWSSQRRGNLLNDMPDRVGKTLGTTDPPKHTFARGLVNAAFTRRTIAILEPKIKALAHKLSTEAHERGTIEFVGDVSAPYNAAILGSMFGVPESDFIQLRHWLDDFFVREKAKDNQEPRQQVANRKLRAYLNDLAQKRLANPGEDLMSAMLLAEDNGQRLEVEQVVVTSITFLVAGFESTNNLFTNLTRALSIQPQIYQQVRAQPELMPQFVEEGMRWDAAAQGFVRTPTHDIEVHGKVIPGNSQVLLHIGAANRDERFFQNPDQFDIRRDNKGTLALGAGIHYCIGAPLGRLMSHTLFGELVNLSLGWEVDLAKAERVQTPNFRGFSKLPLTLN